MKTCEQRVQEVLQRRDEYVKNRRKRTRRMVLASVCCLLTIGVLWQMFPLWGNRVSVSAKEYEAVWEQIESTIGKTADRGQATLGVVDKLFWREETSDAVAEDDNAAPTRPTGSNASSSNTSKPDYSDTNLQVLGVQEADYVKTDGKYIYTLFSAQNRLSIIEAVDGQLSLVSQLTVEDGYGNGLYVTENRLIVQRAVSIVNERQSVSTLVDVYDITDRADPKLLNTYGQTGSLSSTRMIGKHLYLVSTYAVNSNATQDQVETYVPQTFVGEESYCIPAEDIVINDSCKDKLATYLVISVLDTETVRQVSQKSLLGYGGTMYCNTENLYVSNTITLDDTDSGSLRGTKLYRFSLKDGEIALGAEGTIAGTLLNQFSMDEYAGHLRVVATLDGRKQTTANGIVSVQMGTQTQTLYVLNDKLEVVGSVKNLAPDERVYSVRFDGNIGYFVTFRQTDPLFAADLSDPANPQILSALKIPGFSEYLHPYDDGLLLGLGRDADENGVQSGCVKLTMFDVKDPAAVSEKHTLVLDTCFYTEAEDNHKAILVNAQHNLIAFPGSANNYLIYGYSEEEGFVCRASIMKGDKQFRGLYIGEYFYIVSDRQVSSYRLDTFAPVHELSLTN